MVTWSWVGVCAQDDFRRVRAVWASVVVVMVETGSGFVGGSIVVGIIVSVADVVGSSSDDSSMMIT